jgi:TolB-like protein/Tfp pilus assembly protein PilF
MAGSFIRELKRRNVFRVGVIYIVVGWLLMQVGDVMFPALRLPDWTSTLLVAFLILGLPLALVFAWAFELTPDGVVRTAEVPAEQSITADTGRKINYMIIGVLAVAVVFLLIKDQLKPDAPVAADIELTDHSIAVLPFKNQSASAENAEFFAGGLHDELLTLLSKISDLKVISRTSVERLDPELSIPQIGELLGVATILEGQVQRAGNRLRINVQLIDTAREGHLWANTYDSELTAENVFDVQSDIARTIADALHAELSPADEQLLEAVPTASTAALEKYLLGVQLWNRNSYSAINDAIAYLTEATELDPDYTDAWVQLASAYASAFQTGALDSDEYMRGAEPAVRRALQLDPRRAAAYTQQALLQWLMDDIEGAERSFAQALELDSDDPGTIAEYALFLRVNYRAEEAIPLIERALGNDPLSTELLFQLGKAEMHSGRPERFVELAARIREIDPSVVNSYVGALQANLWMGRLARASQWFIKALEFDPLDYENWAHLAAEMDTIGDTETADRYIERAAEIGPGEPAVLKCTVLVELRRGNIDVATRIAKEALAEGLDNRWGSDAIFMRTVRDAAIDSGEVGDILELYRERAPGAFGDNVAVTSNEFSYAVDAILLLQYLGEDEAADRLIDAALAYYNRINPKRIRGYDLMIADVELLALDGQADLAIERLREAVESGWLVGWHYYVFGRNLDAIRERPEFQGLVAQLQERTAEQAAEWAATPHLGEFDLRDAPRQ